MSFRVLSVVVESLLLVGGFLLALLVRFGSTAAVAEYPGLVPKALVCAFVVQLCLYYNELYDYRGERRRLELLQAVGRSLVVATLLLMVVFFAVPVLRVGRGPFALYLACAGTLLLAWRLLVLWGSKAEGLAERVLVLGTGPSARQVTREIERRVPESYRILGFLSEHAQEVGRTFSPVVLDTLEALEATVAAQRPTLIVVALEDRRRRMPVQELLRCRMDGIRVIEAASLLESLSGRIVLKDLRPSWLIFSRGFRKPRLLARTKRMVEAAAAFFALALAAPVMALVAALVELARAGPVLYRQTRVGEGGRIFNLLKFRTMRQDAESDSGPVWASPDGDPRVTRLGRWLRAARLDELPQLWNVLRGDMSFVGPRPERPHFVEKLRKVIPYYDERLSVKPGITGWAQVKYPYGSTLEDAEEKLEYDLYYIKHMSPLFDLGILLETAKVMLLGRGGH